MDTPTPVAGSSPTTENTPAVAPVTPTPVAPAPAAAAPAAPTPAAPAPDAPKPTGADVLGALNADERRQYMGGKKFSDIIAARPASRNAVPATPAAPAPVAAPAAPAPVAAAPAPAPVEPAAPAAPAPTPDDNAEDTPDRFRFKNAEDKAIALLAKTKGISIREATKLYEGPSAAPAAPAEPIVDTELADYDSQITKLDERVKKLTADRLKAREDMDTEKGDALSDEIAEARTSAVLLKNERQGFVRNREQAAAQNAQQQIISSRDRAIAQYPELQVEGSMPQLALSAYVQRAIDDPSRAAEFKDPSWPEKLTHEFAQKQGLKKAGSAVPTPAPAAPTPAPAAPPPQALLRPQPKQVPGAKLVTSADGSQPSAPPAITAAQLQADFSRMTPAQRHAILFPVKRA